MSGAAAPEPSGRVGPLSAGQGRQVPSHAAIRKPASSDPRGPPLTARPPSPSSPSVVPNGGPQRLCSAIPGNAEKCSCRETLQLLPFSCRESLFINSWDFLARNPHRKLFERSWLGWGVGVPRGSIFWETVTATHR